MFCIPGVKPRFMSALAVALTGTTICCCFCCCRSRCRCCSWWIRSRCCWWFCSFWMVRAFGPPPGAPLPIWPPEGPPPEPPPPPPLDPVLDIRTRGVYTGGGVKLGFGVVGACWLPPAGDPPGADIPPPCIGYAGGLPLYCIGEVTFSICISDFWIALIASFSWMSCWLDWEGVADVDDSMELMPSKLLSSLSTKFPSGAMSITWLSISFSSESHSGMGVLVVLVADEGVANVPLPTDPMPESWMAGEKFCWRCWAAATRWA
uniref:(northern house mosquito) hypothetical protein n=1 Tax=Culex pipiens TaxID=7175 RepID=A0A8D8NPH4_CULPI